METYTEQWNRYRRRRLLCFVLFLMFVPVGMAAMELSWKMLRTAKPGFAVAIVWVLLLLSSSLWLLAWPCPRCGKTYIGNWFNGNLFLFRKCVHCGLPKFAGR
jgi:hypothetical protein